MASLEPTLVEKVKVMHLLKDLVHIFVPCKVGVEVTDYVINYPNGGSSLERVPSLPLNELYSLPLVHAGAVIITMLPHSLDEAHL